MTTHEISPNLAQPEEFGAFAPPAETPYPPHGLQPLDGPSLTQYYQSIAAEAQAGNEWLSRLAGNEGAATVAHFDAAHRSEVVAFEGFIGAKTATAQNVHGAFGEAYNNYWRYVAQGQRGVESASVPAPVTLFKLPEGGLLLTMSYIAPTAEETLHKLRASLLTPMEDDFWERARHGAAAISPEEEQATSSQDIDTLLAEFPDLDAEEHGRGTVLARVYSDKSGIARIVDADGNLGLCHWYLIRDGSDTSVEQRAAEYHASHAA